MAHYKNQLDILMFNFMIFPDMIESSFCVLHLK